VFFTTVEVNNFTVCFLQKYFFWSVDFGTTAGDTELSIAIATPHIQLPLIVECHCVLGPALDLHDVLETGDFMWDNLIFVVAVAESAGLATAPSVYFTFVG